jgi:hypothetical protein
LKFVVVSRALALAGATWDAFPWRTLQEAIASETNIALQINKEERHDLIYNSLRYELPQETRQEDPYYDKARIKFSFTIQ